MCCRQLVLSLDQILVVLLRKPRPGAIGVLRISSAEGLLRRKICLQVLDDIDRCWIDRRKRVVGIGCLGHRIAYQEFDSGIIGSRRCLGAGCNVGWQVLGEISGHLGVTRQGAAVIAILDKTIAGPASEEEVFVVTNWPAESSAVTVLVVRILGCVQAGVMRDCIEVSVAEELECRTVKGIGAVLGNDADDRGRIAPKLCAVVIGSHI